MKPSFTTNDLLQFVYQDLSASKSLAVQDAILSDFDLREEYLLIRETQENLDKIKKAPSEACIDFIMKYSQREAVSSLY